MPAGRPKAFCTETAVDRAMEVFWDQGYESTSMASLVEAMGIGRQSLYDTYGDKHQLFIAALNHYIDGQFQHVLDMLDAPVPAIDVITNLFEGWRNHNTTCHRGCLLSNTMSEFAAADPQVAEIHRTQLDRLTTKFQEVIRRGQHEGSVTNNVDAAGIARMLVTLGQGLTTMGRCGSDPSYVLDSVQTIQHLITRT